MRKKHKIIFSLSVFLFLLYMLLWPERTLAGSRNGLLLWFQTVLPTLLPFLILSNLLLHTQILTKLLHPLRGFFFRVFGLSPYGGYALILGLFCGYPMGAKITADLFGDDRITRREAAFLLAVSNNPSPVFLITYVLREELHTENDCGRILLLFYGGILLSALLLRLCCGPGTEENFASGTAHKKETSHPLPIGVLIDVSIMNGFETITKLGGYIILCSIGSTALDAIPDACLPVRAFLSSILEISTGIHQLALLPLPGKTALLGALCSASFGGLCILMQTYSVIRGTGLPISYYLKGKLLQTFVIASVLFILL